MKLCCIYVQLGCKVDVCVCVCVSLSVRFLTECYSSLQVPSKSVSAFRKMGHGEDGIASGDELSDWTHDSPG